VSLQHGRIDLLDGGLQTIEHAALEQGSFGESIGDLRDRGFGIGVRVMRLDEGLEQIGLAAVALLGDGNKATANILVD
jgi:hypothetical protein